MSEFKCPSCGATLTVAHQKPKQTVSIDYAKDLLLDYADKLDFEDTPDYVVIRPKEFLGKQTFGKIARIIKDAGGEYVSAGKQSHFRLGR